MTMDEQHIVDHDRDWIIGCIKHDGFIHTHRFDKANQIILEALQFAEHFDLLKEHESLQEVVRCKDCLNYKKINPKAKSGMCYKDIVASAWNDDGFCSSGERREDSEA